jgi:hypothetical protein
MKFNLLLLSAFALASASVSERASAVTITNPLTLQTQFVAGTLTGQPGNSNIATETLIAQHILNLALGQVDGAYAANTVFNYSGTITANGGQHPDTILNDGIVSIPAGWGGALAKYDGDNGGYVLFLFGGQASTIPEYPWNFWTTNQSQYRISHYTLFNGQGDVTPNPTSVPEGGVGVALLGLALAGLAGARRLIHGRAALRA